MIRARGQAVRSEGPPVYLPKLPVAENEMQKPGGRADTEDIGRLLGRDGRKHHPELAALAPLQRREGAHALACWHQDLRPFPLWRRRQPRDLHSAGPTRSPSSMGRS